MSNETMIEVFQNIERHLKNISISLRVIEEINQQQHHSDYFIPINLDNLKKSYDFGDANLGWDQGMDSKSS